MLHIIGKKLKSKVIFSSADFFSFVAIFSPTKSTFYLSEQISAVSESVSRKSEIEHLQDTPFLQKPPVWDSFPDNQSSSEQSLEKAPSNRFSKSVPAHDVYCEDNKSRKSDRYTKLFQSNGSQPMSGCDMLITPARPVAPVDVYLDEYDSHARDHQSESDLGSRKSMSTAQASQMSEFFQEDPSHLLKSATKREPASRTKTDKMERDFRFLKPNLPSHTIKSVDVFVDDDCVSNRGFDGKQIDDFDFMSTGIHVNGPPYRKVIRNFIFHQSKVLIVS